MKSYIDDYKSMTILNGQNHKKPVQEKIKSKHKLLIATSPLLAELIGGIGIGILVGGRSPAIANEKN